MRRGRDGAKVDISNARADTMEPLMQTGLQKNYNCTQLLTILSICVVFNTLMFNVDKILKNVIASKLFYFSNNLYAINALF